ncbi:hypothetical protein [Nitratireductor soli]|nr:hypothetical protein [Nitratireductor soli]
MIFVAQNRFCDTQTGLIVIGEIAMGEGGEVRFEDAARFLEGLFLG